MDDEVQGTDGTSPAADGPATHDLSPLVQVVRAGHDGDPTPARRVLADRSSDPELRASAVAALVRLARSGHVAAPEAMRAITVALGDPSPDLRRRAALEATRLVPTMSGATHDTDTADTDTADHDAAGSAHRMHADPIDVGSDEPTDVDALVTALAALLVDDDHTVAEVAAFACGEVVPSPVATVALDDSERGAAIAALCRNATGHAEHLCREAAVAALGSIGDGDGLPGVLAGCRDRASVRRRAVLALAAFDGPEVTAELQRLTSDRDLQVRQAAEELLAIETGEST